MSNTVTGVRTVVAARTQTYNCALLSLCVLKASPAIRIHHYIQSHAATGMRIVVAARRQIHERGLLSLCMSKSQPIDLLEKDARIDTTRIGIWGHSRHGKSALVAAAWDDRIGLVMAHQSGFGGSALSRSKTGERIDRVAQTYPHWFTPAFQDFAKAPGTLPLDQHQLLALLAPRPVFLGNGRRDVWSDPNSTYRAAQAADRVYKFYGSEGLAQTGLRDFNPAADLSFHMRAGAHGTTPEDVAALFAFLDAHWGL